jgi:hypothetical protein
MTATLRLRAVLMAFALLVVAATVLTTVAPAHAVGSRWDPNGLDIGGGP